MTMIYSIIHKMFNILKDESFFHLQNRFDFTSKLYFTTREATASGINPENRALENPGIYKHMNKERKKRREGETD